MAGVWGRRALLVEEPDPSETSGSYMKGLGHPSAPRRGHHTHDPEGPCRGALGGHPGYNIGTLENRTHLVYGFKILGAEV